MRGTDIFLRNVNLNLLPILQTLLKTQSVTRTAAALGLSQPAVSDALSRLRDLLDDQLLVRIGAGMKLTPLAIDLIEPLESLCAGLEGFLKKTSFDPRNAKREFIVAASDFGALVMARPILDMLLREAPGVSLHLIHIEQDLTHKMAARDIDFAILPRLALDTWAVGPVRAKSVGRITQVALMRKGHPLTARRTVSKADMSRYRAVVFQPDVTLQSPRKFLDQSGVSGPEIAASVGQILLVPRLITGTDFISVVPEVLSEEVSDWLELDSRPLSFEPPGAEFVLAWSPVQDSDPAHKWFRTTLVNEMSHSRKCLAASDEAEMSGYAETESTL